MAGGKLVVMAGLKMIIPKTVGSNSFSASGYAISDVRKLTRALKELDPKLRSMLVKEAKEPAKPVQSAVKSAIPAVAPLSGMTGGRLNWSASLDGKGRVHGPKDVKIQFRTSMSGKSLTTALVRVAVASPAVVVADMAGKSGRFIDAGYKGSGRTRVYNYKGGQRSHRVNGQGRAMIRALGGTPSRFVWPAAERAIPAASDAIDRVLTKFANMVNQRGF